MKCLQCGIELNGNKFCTNCGAPAPQEPTGSVCTNCGQPVDGKFCTQCGTPAQQPVQPENKDVSNATETEPKPIDYQNPYTDNVNPVQYNANINQPNEAYTGQQYTNQPDDASNGKKPMSGGKIALIIISIVVGLMIIFGIIVGFIACKIYNVTQDNDIVYNDNYLSSYIDDYSSRFDDYLDDYIDDNSSTQVTDEKTGLVFEQSDDYDGWAVVDYNTPDYDISKITVEIPEKFQGKEVVEINRLYVYDNDSTEEGYIKIIIPGTVKVIDDYSISFLDEINEVVIKDGVEKIEECAFTGDNDLTKIHIPASVTDMADDCGIGYDEYDEPIKGFKLYCAKGSTAEKYAKAHNLDYEIEK